MDATQHRRIQRRTGTAPASAASVILAIIAGQSNAEGGRSLTANRDAGDVDVTGAYQFEGYSGRTSTYRTVQSDITPLWHYSGWSDVGGAPTYLGPGEYLARQLLTDNPSAKVVLVPCAKGSTAMAQSGDAWFPHATSGGFLFENMISQANLARTAVATAFPGSPIQIQFYWVQGEQDSGAGVSRATYLASMTNFIAYARSQITGASSAQFIIGSMIPQLWDPTDPHYQSAYAAINTAQVDVSVDIPNTYYRRGPATSADGLHYCPQAILRAEGLGWGAAVSDTVGPTMTSSATFSNLASSALSLALTCNDLHATFHINGGAGANNFEISDRYLNPVLRWTGNGTGPAAGTYLVGVRARDGSGNFGATQTITITVSTSVSATTFFTAGERGMVWDLSDTTKLFQNVAGTNPVTAAGQPVGKVLDISGNGNHWIAQGDNATRPTYQVDSDGKPYLSFDGSDDALIANTPFISASDWKYSVCAGVYGASPGTYGGILVTASSTAGDPLYEAIGYRSGGDISMDSVSDAGGGGGSQPTLTAMLDNATKRVISGSYNGDGFVCRLRNAAVRPSGGGTGSYQSTTPGFGSRAFTGLNKSVLGARGFESVFPSRFIAGRIYSGFAIGRFLTDAKVKSGENWVGARALTAALP